MHGPLCSCPLCFSFFYSVILLCGKSSLRNKTGAIAITNLPQNQAKKYVEFACMCISKLKDYLVFQKIKPSPTT